MNYILQPRSFYHLHKHILPNMRGAIRQTQKQNCRKFTIICCICILVSCIYKNIASSICACVVYIYCLFLLFFFLWIFHSLSFPIETILWLMSILNFQSVWPISIRFTDKQLKELYIIAHLTLKISISEVKSYS